MASTSSPSIMDPTSPNGGGFPPTPRATPETSDRRVEGRVRALLEVAAQVGTGVRVPELAALLPVGAPDSQAQVVAWLAARPGIAVVRGDLAFSPRLEHGPDPTRRRRGDDYWQAAQVLRTSTFRPMLPFVLALGVTGSAAYGEPEEGDDLDLLAITRPGTLWLFLAYAYLAIRLGRGPHLHGRPLSVCLNYVRVASEAEREFAAPQGFLFAREALMTRILLGTEYYDHLLGRAPWMAREIPRLYARRRSALPGEGISPRVERAGWPARLLNLALFPVLGAYLQAQGLRRNARLRREGRSMEVFQSVTRLERLSFVSDRFERIRENFQEGPPGRGRGIAATRSATRGAGASTPSSPAPWG